MLMELSVYRRCSMTALGAAALLCPGLISAQPGSTISERELAQTIREAGYDCRGVESVDNPTNPPSGWESFRPDIVLCTNVQRGLRSSTYDRGRYSVKRENGVHHFHMLLSEFLGEKSGKI